MSDTYKPLKIPGKSVTIQNNERYFWNISRLKANADFYTIGYSGRKIPEFIDLLKSVNICSVVDIRFSPMSKFHTDFNRSNIQPILDNNEIAYFHRPELGIPRDIRGMAIE